MSAEQYRPSEAYREGNHLSLKKTGATLADHVRTLGLRRTMVHFPDTVNQIMSGFRACTEHSGINTSGIIALIVTDTGTSQLHMPEVPQPLARIRQETAAIRDPETAEHAVHIVHGDTSFTLSTVTVAEQEQTSSPVSTFGLIVATHEGTVDVRYTASQTTAGGIAEPLYSVRILTDSALVGKITQSTHQALTETSVPRWEVAAGRVAASAADAIEQLTSHPAWNT